MLLRFTFILLSFSLILGCNETTTQTNMVSPGAVSPIEVQKSPTSATIPEKETSIESGGMDSGGGNGLFYRLQNALDLSLEVLSIVKVDNLEGISGKEIFDFYKKNRKKLLIEAITTEIETKSADEVFIIFNGEKKFEKMITKLKPGATIFVTDDLNVTDPIELTANIIHELIHHLGFPEEEDKFLDEIALVLVQTALKLNPTFKKKVQTCISPEKFMEQLDGVWTGSIKTPWTEDYDVEFEFNSGTGTYNSSVLCEGCENTSSSTYWGNDGPDIQKAFEIEEACGGNASGLMDLFESTTTRAEQRFIKLSEDRTELSFEIYYNNRGPLKYKLRRNE